MGSIEGGGLDKDRSSERITFAAYRWKGEIFVAQGTFHPDAMGELQKRFPGTELSNEEIKEAEGWVTSTGRFVTAHEAFQVGAASDQIDFTNVRDFELHSDNFRKPDHPGH